MPEYTSLPGIRERSLHINSAGSAKYPDLCPSCQAWWPLLQTLLEPCYIMSKLSRCHQLGQQC